MVKISKIIKTERKMKKSKRKTQVLTYTVGLFKVILLFSIGVELASPRENREFALAGSLQWLFSPSTIEVSVEDARMSIFTQKHQGICQRFEVLCNWVLRFISRLVGFRSNVGYSLQAFARVP